MKLKKILAAVLLTVILCLNLTSCSEFANTFITELNKQMNGDGLLGQGKDKNVEAIVNEITEKKIHAVVTVVATFSNNKYPYPSTFTTQSSGVIISYDGRTLVLTNNHSVSYDSNAYSLSKITLIDYVGDEYQAYIYNGLGKLSTAPEYDLACLYAPSIESKLDALTLAKKNPKINDKVIALSTPSGQPNAISFGKVLTYAKTNVVDTDESVSNVTEDIIWHSAKIKQGSSGGALVNYDLELVGINFAGSENANNSFTEGGAIPIEMVLDFLQKYT